MTSRTAHILGNKWRSEDIKLQENVDFSGLLLSENVLKGLTAAGFVIPSPIQLQAIPLGRCGLDLIVQAKSGTGKTCVFAVIALESIILSSSATQALVLAPTREIAAQVCDVVRSVGSSLSGLECHMFIGGLPVSADKVKLKKCHIAVGTPGRMKQLIEEGFLKTQSVRLYVLDEADKLLEASFQEDINWIYSSLPKNKQMIALSATYPKKLADLLTYYMRNPAFARLNAERPALLGITQYWKKTTFHPLQHISYQHKIDELWKIISSITFSQCLIFSNYQTRAQSLCDALTKRGWPASYISGSHEQTERLKTIEQMKNFKCRMLISTDLTARGIDVENVNLVINIDVPWDAQTYLHRIGRAGRYGSKGIAITLASSGDETKKLLDFHKQCHLELHQLPDPLPEDLWMYAPVSSSVSDCVSNNSCTDSISNTNGEVALHVCTQSQVKENAVSYSFCDLSAENRTDESVEFTPLDTVDAKNCLETEEKEKNFSPAASSRSHLNGENTFNEEMKTNKNFVEDNDSLNSVKFNEELIQSKVQLEVHSETDLSGNAENVNKSGDIELKPITLAIAEDSSQETVFSVHSQNSSEKNENVSLEESKNFVSDKSSDDELREDHSKMANDTDLPELMSKLYGAFDVEWGFTRVTENSTCIDYEAAVKDLNKFSECSCDSDLTSSLKFANNNEQSRSYSKQDLQMLSKYLKENYASFHLLASQPVIKRDKEPQTVDKTLQSEMEGSDNKQLSFAQTVEGSEASLLVKDFPGSEEEKANNTLNNGTPNTMENSDVCLKANDIETVKISSVLEANSIPIKAVVSHDSSSESISNHIPKDTDKQDKVLYGRAEGNYKMENQERETKIINEGESVRQKRKPFISRNGYFNLAMADREGEFASDIEYIRNIKHNYLDSNVSASDGDDKLSLKEHLKTEILKLNKQTRRPTDSISSTSDSDTNVSFKGKSKISSKSSNHHNQASKKSSVALSKHDNKKLSKSKKYKSQKTSKKNDSKSSDIKSTNQNKSNRLRENHCSMCKNSSRDYEKHTNEFSHSEFHSQPEKKENGAVYSYYLPSHTNNWCNDCYKMHYNWYFQNIPYQCNACKYICNGCAWYNYYQKLWNSYTEIQKAFVQYRKYVSEMYKFKCVYCKHQQQSSTCCKKTVY